MTLDNALWLLLGISTGVSAMAWWSYPHLRAANRLLKYAREKGTVQGFDWGGY